MEGRERSSIITGGRMDRKWDSGDGVRPLALEMCSEWAEGWGGGCNVVVQVQ